jgi:hypothetical protein
MVKQPRIPTRIRTLNADEWAIVVGVFNSSNLPFRLRVWITNGCGAEGRAFTIPTSLISSLPMAFAAGLAGVMAADLMSALNLAFIINVGPDIYDNLAATDASRQDLDASATLVHEMTHVWQGRNSKLALSYVFGSVISQAFAKVDGSNAYDYKPLRDWSSYNAEQQGQLVEDWYWAGQSASDARWPYIRDYVRLGKV